MPFRLQNQKWDTYHVSGTQLWLDRASSFAPNPCRNAKGSRQTRIGQNAPRRASAAHLGWVRAAALPRGRTVPARRPLCWRRPIGARKKRKATGLAGEPPAAAARSPTAASQGHSDRQPAATAAQDGSPGQLLRALRAGANWSPPNSHPAHTGATTP